jgi:hypothetical protein
MAHQTLQRTREELAAAIDGHPGLLRLQAGFNPNSSSVGSVVQFMLWSAVAATAVFQTAALLFPRTAITPTTEPPPADPA